MKLKNYQLSPYLNEEDKVKFDFYDACSANDLNKVKNLLLSKNLIISDFFSKDYDPNLPIKINDPIDISIIRKAFDVTKYLLSNHEVRKNLTFNHYIKYYDAASKAGKIEIIDTILHDSNFKSNCFYEIHKKGILNCIQFGHLEAIKYFRNLPNRKQNSSEIKDENYFILAKACEYNKLDIFEYIYSNSKIQNYKLKKEELDMCIYNCFTNNSFEIINFLIFNLNLELTDSIKKRLESYSSYMPNEKKMIENWFASRDLAIHLNKNLGVSNEVNKTSKNKI